MKEIFFSVVLGSGQRYDNISATVEEDLSKEEIKEKCLKEAYVSGKIDIEINNEEE